MGPHRRRALVIAYNFPPDAAIGTMRTLRVVQRLVDEGWDVAVLTSDPTTFRPGTPVDDALLARVPAAVRVLRAPSIRPFEQLKRFVAKAVRGSAGSERASSVPVGVSRPAKRKRGVILRAVDAVDAALAIPDQESAWLLPAVSTGLRLFATWRPDVIYSTAPPWTGQLVARALALACRRPWVADFRDPWGRAPWRGDRFRFAVSAGAFLEERIVRAADRIVFVTRANREDFVRQYGPTVASKFHVVPNGCDPSEFERVARPAGEPSEPFTLLHAGTLYAGRTPAPLFAALRRGLDEGVISPDRFRVRFLGTLGLASDLAALTRELGIGDLVEFLPRVPREQSIQAMVSASALLLLQPGHAVSIPGKLYEYFASGRPILSIAEEGEISALIRESGIGEAVTSDNEGEILDALLRVMARAATPVHPPPRALYDGGIGAANIVGILGAVACGDAPPAAIGVGIQP